MSLSAPSPPASTSSDTSSRRNSSSGSPQLVSDLGLDPSDPLNLLLHNSRNPDTFMDDSSVDGTPPDWSQLSSLWPSSFEGGNFGGDGNTKGFPDVMDFSMPLGSELDFSSQMAIDPHALHFDAQKFGLDDFSLSNDLTPGHNFPFTFQPGVPAASSPFGRRSSITSSSSSSGASLSPVIEPCPEPSHLKATESTAPSAFDSAADELAQRVRQSAGVTLAVPVDSQLQQGNGAVPDFSMYSGQTPAFDFAPPSFGSLTSPSSPHSFQSSGSSVSSAPSTPPPATPPPSEPVKNLAINASMPDANTFMSAGGSMGMIPRPKTSHTTIERRYRTNLNARIMSLRMAVPALRVLEDKEGCGVGGGGKKGKGKNATLGKNIVFGSKVKKEGEDGEDVVDVIDERGFVDGVKVARKCSKANVLGKAVEYIRVLKKRENRLKREQDGLKSLITGLVGGPALLREWEREWREKFGGEEKDEVEGEEMDDGGSDDEGIGSGDDDDADDESSRKRKKPKIAPAKKEPKEKRPPPPPQPVVLPDGSVVVPEKRKRGRPRKVPVAPATTELGTPPNGVTPLAAAPPSQAQHLQPAQYLLATFALFSFFNSPFTTSSSPTYAPPNHSHTGSVLTPGVHSPSPIHVQPVGWSWNDVTQAFHLLVSILVFASILTPWLPAAAKYLSLSQLKKLYVSTSSPVAPAPKLRRSRSSDLVASLSSSKRGTDEEAAGLREALDNHHGVFATVKNVLGKSKDNVGFEQKGLEQRAWVRLGEIAVLGGKTSMFNRALTCWHMRSHLSWFTASAADLSTLALAVWPMGHIAHRHAHAFWEAARGRKGFSGVREGGVGVQVRPYERLVLESMSVEQAFDRLKSPALQAKKAEWARYSPIGILACMLVRQRVKHHLELMFVKTVLPVEGECELEDDSATAVPDVAEENEEEERRKTIEAARSLGGEMAELGDTLQRIWTMGVWELDDITVPSDDGDESDEEQDLDSEIRVLLNALILYRQIFSSSILGSAHSGVSILLSPPPSPIRQNVKLHLALRRLLGSTVFDSGNSAMEDARDRLVDMLVECERAGRST